MIKFYASSNRKGDSHDLLQAAGHVCVQMNILCMVRVKKISMLVILSSSFVFLIVVTAGLIGYISLRNGTQAVNDLARQLQAQVVIHIQETLGEYLAMPHRLNRLNAALITHNPALLDDLKALRLLYVRQLQAFEMVATVAIGLEEQGNFVGVGRRENGFFSSGLMDREQDSTYRVSLLDEQGSVLRLLTETSDYDARTRSWYASVVQVGRAVWSPIYVWAGNTGIGITSTLPLYDPDGALLAVQQSALTLDFISTFLQGLRIGKAGQVFLIEQDGMLVASSTSEHVLRKNAQNFERIQAVESEVPFIRTVSSHLGSQFGSLDRVPEHYHANLTIDGQQHFVSVAKLHDPHGLNWIMIIGLPETEVMEQIDANTRTTVLLCIIASLAATWLGVIIARRLTAANQRLELEIIERKRTEEALLKSERAFRGYFDMGTVGMCVTSPEKGWIEVNDYLCRMLGYSKEKLFQHTWAEMTHPDDLAADIELFHQILAGERDAYELEKRFIHRDGQIIYTLLYVTCQRNPDGRVHYFLASLVDITARKRAEEALRESERKFRFLTERTNDLIYLYRLQPQRGFEYVSPSAERITGYTPEEHYEDPQLGMKLVHPEDAPRLQAFLNGDIESASIALRWRRKDGSMIWTELENIPVYNEAGEFIAIQGKASDITDRKRAEEALRESESLLNAVGEIARIGGWDLDAKTLTVRWTRETYRIHEVQEGDSVSLDEALDFYHPEDRPLLVEALQRALTQGNAFDLELRFLTATGMPLWVRAIGRPIVEDGRITRLIGVFQDITARKQAEETLRESEERFRLAFENANIGMCLVDMAGRFVKVNQQMRAIFGYRSEEFEHMTVNDITHPAYRDVSPNFIQRARTGEIEQSEFEKMYLHHDGHPLWGLVRSALLKDRHGAPLYFISHVQDITERKRTEEALAKSNRLLEAVIKQSPFAAHVLEGDSNHIHVILENDESKRIMGERLEGRRDLDANRPDMLVSRFFTVDGDREIPLAQMPSPRAFQGEIVRNEEFLFRHTDGTEILVEANASPVYDHAGQIIAIVVTFHDITERKRMEEALRESEARFRNIFEYSGAGIALSDLNGTILQTNPTFCAILGYSEEELLNQTLLAISHPDDIDEETRQILRVIAGEYPVYQREKRYLRKDGQTVWGLLTISVIRDLTGAPISVVGQVQDVTERKRVEEALRESEQKYRLLAENVTDVIWTLDLQGRFTYVSPSVKRLRGYTPEEVMQQTLAEALCPGSIEIAIAGLRHTYELLQTGQQESRPHRHELEQPCKDGTTVWTEAITSRMYNEQGEFVGILGVTRDISERRRMEADIRRAKEQAETAERLKSTFFANVSHHLRTPLNVILGFTDLMAADGTLASTYQEYLALIRQNGKELLALLNQMLKVAKLNPEEIMTDESSRQLLDLLESQTPQATLTPQAETHLGEEEFEMLRRRMQELPEELRRRFTEATQRLDIALMSQIIEQVRQAQPAAADALERLARNFEYERILVLLQEVIE